MWEITLEFMDDNIVPVKFKLESENRPEMADIIKIATHNGYNQVKAITTFKLVRLCLPTPNW